MSHYIIYFLDYKKDDSIIIIDSYKNINDAHLNLEKCAIDYVKKLEGEKQANICKQDKTPEQITADMTLREGLYIRKQENSFILYEKFTKITPGYLRNGVELLTSKIGSFGITQYKFDHIVAQCACTVRQPKKIQQSQLKSVPSFIHELQQMFKENDGKFVLKPIEFK